jgi:hypothetical protein
MQMLVITYIFYSIVSDHFLNYLCTEFHKHDKNILDIETELNEYQNFLRRQSDIMDSRETERNILRKMKELEKQYNYYKSYKSYYEVYYKIYIQYKDFIHTNIITIFLGNLKTSLNRFSECVWKLISFSPKLFRMYTYDSNGYR